MARLTKPMLIEQMMIKIRNMEMLCQEFRVEYDNDYDNLLNSYTVVDLNDNIEGLNKGEETLYILRSKFRKD